MNHNVALLDCTIRDGGYLNDWNFGRDNIISIFERLASSGVDVIEVGFLDDRRSFDPNRTIMPDTASANKIFGKLDKKNSMAVGMIDYGTCRIENIQPCDECWLDGIRIIFKKEKMDGALDFCAQVKALGYKVFVQAVSITSYSDNDLCRLVEKVNELKPYAVSMVDTYGLLEPATLLHISQVIDQKLDRDIALGFHAHNNFQLGYANAMALLNAGFDRKVLVDGTLYGMGKSAGNAPVELIAMYMNAHFNTCYDISQMQEAIATCILDMYRRQPWGYTQFYYLAAANQCHPDYVAYLMNKRTLSVTAISEILQQIPAEKKLGKDTKMLEQLYLNYQKNECNDTETLTALHEQLKDKHVLMLGPGATIATQKDTIKDFIAQQKPVVIAINYLPQDISINYLFLTNAKRYLNMSGALLENADNDLQIIATSNITKATSDFPYIVNFSSLIDTEAEFPDNSMVMLLKLLERIGVKNVSLAGFDGYTPDNLNYFNTNMEYSFVKEKADSLNSYAKNFFSEFVKRVNITFITPTKYQD